eukprot:XP_003730284.1 PREDICTED: sushi, von Willebrand factor type A, EGF and pentraxin domain-containing protein 1 [Strongylocentrotus purpuratus]
MIGSTNDTVATPANLKRWGLSEDDACKLCQQRATTAHILVGCPTGLQQGQYAWRHNRLLGIIGDALKTRLTEHNQKPTRTQASYIYIVREGEATNGSGRSYTGRQRTCTDGASDWNIRIDLGENKVSGSNSGTTFSVSSSSRTIQYRATDSAGNYATCEITFKVVGIRCSTLVAPSRGQVGCTNSNFISSVCTYSCSTGYRVVGVTTQSCYQSGNDGSWTGLKPSCQRITCSSISAPTNGALSCTDGSYYGSSCTFSCDYGYTLEDSQPTWTCLQSGQWSNGHAAASRCVDTLPPTFTQCPMAQTVYAPALETSASVWWSVPVASDNSGDVVSLVRDQGPAPGSTFGVGNQFILYKVTDSAGNEAVCSFSVTVKVVYCPAQAADPPLQISCPQSNIRGSECTFSCSTGYILQGRQNLQCMMVDSTGVWSSDTPSCQILQCEDLSLENGGMTGDCSRDYGSSCHFECDAGYEINTDVLTCVAQPGSSSAVWQGDSPTCTRIQCRKPQSTTALQISITSECPSGSLVPSGNPCNFLCSEGYFLQGVEDSTCREDRSWSNEFPTCHLITCEVADVPVPMFAVKQGCTTGEVNYGTVCTLSCQEGYEATKSSEMTCLDDGNGVGTWSGDSIECTFVTCPVPSPESVGTTVSCSYSGISTAASLKQNYSASCTYGCGNGYSMTEGTSQRVCLASGDWNGIPVICEDLTSPDLSCHDDVDLIADPGMLSAEIPWGQWEPLMASDFGTSIEATLFSINSDEVGPNRPSSFSEGSHTLGYRAVDSSGNEVHCSFTVTVRVLRCQPLPIPDRSIVSLVSGLGSCHGGVVYGSVCTISCELGYTLSTGGGSLNRSCDISESDQSNDGTWSGPDPVCDVVNCNVPAVTNGLSDCQSSAVPYLTPCQFDCQPGYRAPSREESTSRTCQADYHWSGSDFQCTEIVQCPARFSISYGSVEPSECSSFDFVPFGFNCEFTCGTGFVVQGLRKLVCNTNGQWNQNAPPTCEDVEPPIFDVTCPLNINMDAKFASTTAEIDFHEPTSSDNSGIVNITRLDSEYIPGSEFPEGDTRIRYQATDAFGLSSFCDVVISVKVHRCSVQQPPLHGAVTGCIDSFIGSRCLFSCDVGYNLEGTSSLQCELTSDGTSAWNDVTPTCLPQQCPALQIPEFASLSGCDSSPVPFGSICTFSCELGYTGIGESMKTCLEEEVWSSTSFVCERLPCEALSEPSSITISPETCLSGPRFGDVCTLECEQFGFKITPPDLKEVTCSSDQTWTGEVEQAQCVDLQLPVFEDCPSDFVAFANKSSNKANVEWSAVATDNDPSQEPVVTCNLQPGILPIGVHVVICSAQDEADNEATCQFRVEVKEISCAPLVVPDLIRVSPEACSESDIVPRGTVCTLNCNFDLTLEGDKEPLTCLNTGEWDRELNTVSLLCKDKIPPTLIYCPSHIFTTRTQYWGVEENFVYPSAEDNFDMALQVTADPPDLTSPYIFTSDTTCTYTFTDDAGNSVSCIFQIDITNEVQPIITSCPTGREMITSERVGLVDWEKPLYMDMPGVELVTSCNTPKSPVELPWGDHDIMCHVTDPDSGLQAACRMPFKIRPVPCAALAIPAHGALACDNFAFGRYCSVLCEDGYDVPRVRSRRGSTSTMKLFICGNSGLWFPQHLVPDCSETRSSRHNLPLTMYYPSPCSHDDTASTEAVATKFLQIIEQSYFHDICTDNHLCTVDNVNVSCGSVTDRRRRSISDNNMDMASQREGSDIKVTMLLQVSPPNNHNRGIDGEGKGAEDILHRLAQHIHSHIQHHIMEADGPEWTMEKSEEGEDILEQPGHQQFKPEATLLLGDISLQCDPGHYLNKDLQTCVPCPAGYYLDVASEICTPCNQGFFQDDQAQTDCKPCKNGTSTRNQGATHSNQCEVLCGPGHFSSTGFSPCMRCEQGSYQSLHGQTRCENCPPMLTTPDHSGTSADDCQEPCPAGHFSKSGLHPCTLCPPGFYQPHPQRTSCRRCPGYTTTTMSGAISINSCHIVK